MKIAINAIPALTGNAYEIAFGREVLKRLPGLLPEHEFFFEHDFDSDLLKPENVTGIQFGKSVDDSIYFSIGRPHYLNSDFAPVVLALMEADHITYPKRPWWKFGKPVADPISVDISEATFILVPHKKLYSLIADAYPQVAAKIRIVGHGQSPAKLTPADSVTRRITKEVYGKEHSFFFAPSTGHESDNLERLIQAYDLFRQRVPEPVRLLIERPHRSHLRSVQKLQKQAKFRDDIELLSELTEHEHHKIFSSARAILYPSLSTRFPLPVLEAWTAEVPVVYTDNDILRGAGALVQGEDPNSIAEGMVSLVTTPFLASGLVENGKRRLKDFSWEAVAEKVAGVLREVAA